MASSTLDRRKVRWYERRPLLRNAFFTDLQRGSYIVSIYSIFVSLFMMTLSIFDIYCLAEAEPGSTHYRYFGISFLFVYSGNKHVRNILITVSLISFLLAIYLLVATVILMLALRKEYEQRFKHWLRSMFVFTIWRLLAIIFRSIANDIYFSYHQAMLVIWLFIIQLNVFALAVVYSNYQELEDITRLEDMAKLKMGTMSSLSASASGSHSLSQRSISHHSMDMDSMKNSHSISPAGSHSTASAHVTTY